MLQQREEDTWAVVSARGNQRREQLMLNGIRGANVVIARVWICSERSPRSEATS